MGGYISEGNSFDLCLSNKFIEMDRNDSKLVAAARVHPMNWVSNVTKECINVICPDLSRGLHVKITFVILGGEFIHRDGE